MLSADFVKSPLFSDLEEIDDLTPVYKRQLRRELSTQERKVLVIICGDVADGEINARRVALISRIGQTNHTHAVLGHLVKKGFLMKVRKSVYLIQDKKLVAHLLVRACGIRPKNV